MSYSSVVKGESVTTETTGLTTLNQKTAAIRGTYRADRTASRVQTYILITPELAKLAGLRAGTRVSVLEGKGKDAGKFRIVANSKGTYKIGRHEGTYSLRIRTQRVLRNARSTTPARVTSYGKGVITIAL